MTTTALPSQLDRFIPLSKAARRLRLSEKSLRQMITAGRIKGAVLPNGEIGVSEPELEQFIGREQFEHLRGQAITVPQASERHGIRADTFRTWVKRGYISLLKEGYNAEMDLADVEYCVAVYRAQDGGRGKRIFDKDGLPYQYKHTEWAEYQRERRKKKSEPTPNRNGKH
jgi:hypothetical protein